MYLKSTLLALTVALGSTVAAQARILGVSTCWETGEYGPTVIYQIDETAGTLAPVAEVDICGITGLAKRHGGAMYAVNAGTPLTEPGTPMEPHLIRIVPDPVDPDRMTTELVGRIDIENDPAIEHSTISSIAYSASDELYAVEYFRTRVDGVLRTGNALWRLDPDTGQARHSVFRNFENRILSLDFAPSTGALFGWDRHLGLVEIDTATGHVRDVNPDDYYPEGMAVVTPIFQITFTPDGNLLAAQTNGVIEPLGLYWIDTGTGEYSTTGVSFDPITMLAIEHVDDEWITFTPGRRRPTGPPRWDHNLFLVDCLPCPPCFGPGKMCDPRVNENWDRAFINDPLNDIAIGFSRSKIGFTAKDGFLKAGAPVGDAKTDIFVVTAPLAGDGGAVVFFNAASTPIARFDGKAPGTLLGHDMDVRGDHVAVVSTRDLWRFRGSQLVSRMPIDNALFPHRDIQVAFTNDIDGDGQPEILLGGPEAQVGKLPFAGMIQVIGSTSGEVIETRAGTRAGQRLGAAPEWDGTMQ